MSPTSDIVTDANLGCQEDQVAFFQSALRAVFGCVSFESSASLELLARWVRRAAVLEFARKARRRFPATFVCKSRGACECKWECVGFLLW